MPQNFDAKFANQTLKLPQEVFIPSSKSSQIYPEEGKSSPRNSFQPMSILLITLALISFALIAVFLIAYLTSSHMRNEDMTHQLDKRNLHIGASGNFPMDFSLVDGTSDWTVDLTEHENYKLFSDFDCGKSGNELSFRIEGGRPARIMEFPWAVAMFVKNSEGQLEYFCGGTLIHEKLIASAAHCITANVGSEVIVRLGEFNVSSTIDCEYHNGEPTKCADPVQDFSSANFTGVIHSGYDDSTLTHDIGLIKLKFAANLTRNNVKAVCLPFGFKEIPRRMVVTGFGENGKSRVTKTGANVLEVASVGLISNENCKAIYGGFSERRPLTENQFCAADNKSTMYVDTCRGDSGGAIQLPHLMRNKIKKREIEENSNLNYDEVPDNTGEDFNESSARFVQYGIVSFGEKKHCGEGKRPGIYTTIYPYLKWILDNSK